MGLLLENALSEELPDHPPRPSPATTHSSGPPRSGSRSSPPPPPTAATDTDKMLAASIGAVLTSLTMTPFDVVKTRLQTQAPPAPSPHSSLPRATATSTSPWPPPIPSTSSAPPPAHPAVCCNSQAYFNANASASSSSNPARDLLCRFDPRTARAALPAAGAHLHHLQAAPQLVVAGADGAAAWCLYPAAASTAPAAAAPTASASRTLTSSSSTAPSLSPSHVVRPPPPQHQQRHLTGFLDALSHILRAEGPAALWRGTAPALAMSVPGQVGYMVGYDALRRTALRHLGGASGDPAQAAQVVVPLVAGSASRAAVAVVLSPFELVRTRLQAQTRSTRVPLAALVAELRWSTAWRGLSSTLWRDVPFSGVYWAGYEGIKRALTGGRGMGEQHRGATTAAAAGGGAGRNEGARGEFATAFVSGAGSGMIAATLTNPFDVVKTRRQAPSASTKGAAARAAAAGDEARTLALLRHIVRTEGWAALWSGLTPRLAKVGPACGLMIGCYEGISGWRGAQRATERGELE